MSNKAKIITLAILALIIIGLTALVWIQTKLLAVTLGILLVSVAVFYFVMKKL